MKTLLEVLSSIDKDKLAELVACNVYTNEEDVEDIKNDVFNFLKAIENIEPEDGPVILWPFEQEGRILTRIVCVHRLDNSEDDTSPVVEITSETIPEYLDQMWTDPLLERWAWFLGMHAKVDCITETQILLFVADVLSFIIPSNYLGDTSNWNEPVTASEAEWLAWSRRDEFKKFIDTFSAYLTPGHVGNWRYSTKGFCRGCSWSLLGMDYDPDSIYCPLCGEEMYKANILLSNGRRICLRCSAKIGIAWCNFCKEHFADHPACAERSRLECILD